MIRILTVCTGNVCRSPLAAILLAQRLSMLDVDFSSAGTRARPGLSMTPEAQQIAIELGATPIAAAAHSSRFLGETQLQSADFVVAMARNHRRSIVELNPALAGTAFTLRELARLLADVGDRELLRQGAQSNTDDPRTRLRQMLSFVAARRGVSAPSDSPDDDDVVDPFRRSRRTYELSGAQVHRALPAVERLVHLALST